MPLPPRNPVIGTVTPAATLPADCEGELRDLIRDWTIKGDHVYSAGMIIAELKDIIDKYSGLRPMRTDARKP